MLGTILAAVLATGASAGILAYLARTLLRHLLEKDIASYKANLTAAHAQGLEQHKASLARASIEHEVRFTRLHERRAEVVARVFEKLDRFHRSMREWTRFTRIGDLPDMGKLRDAALTARNDFTDYYWSNAIWLERGICDAVNDLIGQLDDPLPDFLFDVNEKGFPNDRAAWLAAAERLTKDVPKARAALESRFRAILGVEEIGTVSMAPLPPVQRLEPAAARNVALDENQPNIAFLRFAIEQLEARIALVDNKSVLLIAVADAIVGGVVWMGYTLLTKSSPAWLYWSAGVLGVLVLALAGASTVHILSAVRPSKRLLGKDVGLVLLGKPGALLWPPKNVPLTPQWYEDQLAALDALAEYRATHYVLLQLVRRKYDRYSTAVFLIKLMSLTAIVGVALLFAAKAWLAL